MAKPHIVIVGAGFGGIEAAKRLAKDDVDITLIDRNNFQLFQPLLYQLSTSMLSAEEIAYPTRSFFRKNKNVDFLMGHVIKIDPDKKEVSTLHKTINYDYLILAAGATSNYFGNDDLAKTTFALKTLNEGIHVRDHVLHMFERAEREPDPQKRKTMLTFVVVGGGPTGIEEAGALAELSYLSMRDEYRHISSDDISIILLEATDKVLPMLPEDLRNKTIKMLESKGVSVRLRSMVVKCDRDRLYLKGDQTIDTNTVIWGAGVKAVPLVSTLGTETDRNGRIVTNKNMQVPNYPEIFALGDCANFMQNGRPLPSVAPVATKGAVVCTENIRRLMRGVKDLREFVYEDMGTLATIGRAQAVVYKAKFLFGSLKMSGFTAWSIWLFVHLLRLAGPLTNMTVTLKWVLNFLFNSRVGRIITNIPDNVDIISFQQAAYKKEEQRDKDLAAKDAAK